MENGPFKQSAQFDSKPDAVGWHRCAPQQSMKHRDFASNVP
jgi:hypothetical protein